MQIRDRHVDVAGIRGVVLDGGLDHTTSKEFLARMDALLAEGVKYVVLDLSKLSYASSLGLAALMRAHRHFAAAGGRIAFANLHSATAKILRVTRLDQVFDLFDTVEEAVRDIEQNMRQA
jgi:anti-sigma B factor antagonist